MNSTHFNLGNNNLTSLLEFPLEKDFETNTIIDYENYNNLLTKTSLKLAPTADSQMASEIYYNLNGDKDEILHLEFCNDGK